MVYKIRQSSLGLFAIVLLIVGCISGLICLFLLRNIPNQQLAYILSFAVLFGLLIYIPRLFSSTNTEITLTNNGLEQKWLRQFLFQRRQDLSIQWKEIADFVFEPHRQFDQFKLHLKDGTVFRMFHNRDHYKDDFKVFLQEFTQKVNELNTQESDKSIAIQEGRPTYTWQTWALGSFAVFLTVLIPILLIRYPPKTQPPLYRWILLIAIYLLAMFILITSILKLKKQRF